MKYNLLIIAVITSSFIFAQAPQLGKDPIKEVISSMSLEEKAQIVVGLSSGGYDSINKLLIKQTRDLVPGAAGGIVSIPRLGITPTILSDGPAGLRISPKRANDNSTYYCTGFPIATLLAATWNQDLVQNVGSAMGNETLEYGADVLLAPGMNIHRNPLCGRNFEYYSEDPLLAGKMAAAFVRGVQSQGVGTSVKHFACNNQETNRAKNDAIVSQRVLREIYLKNFEIAVKESNPWTVMTSYNKLNGRYTSEDPILIHSILRNEWGFNGMVMSDWDGGNNPIEQMKAGNDLLEPGKKRNYDTILSYLKSGKLPVDVIDKNIEHIVDLVQKTPRFKGYNPSNKPDLKAHSLVCRQSATEGLVLLKNEKNTLPLKSSTIKVALFGVASYDLFSAGGRGSGDVNKAYVVNLKQGLENSNIAFEKTIQQAYETYFRDSLPKVNKFNEKAKWNQDVYHLAEFSPSLNDLQTSANNGDVAFITIGRNSGETRERKIKYDFLLTNDETQLLNSVSSAFHKAGKKVVVILNICGVIETASWKNLPDAILVAWQPGQEGGNSIVDVLKGTENPSGKLPMTFPLKYEDVPSAYNFPSEYAENVESAKGKKRNVDYTLYEEGIYVGYRHYSTFSKPVSYPFGYGLSYTDFKYNKLKISQSGDTIKAYISISNSGNSAGKEVVQLYITAPKSKLDKPKYELKAFAKTKLLQPGETQTIEMVFNKYDVASFHESLSSWVADAGNYTISIGASVEDIRVKANFSLDKAWEKKVMRW